MEPETYTIHAHEADHIMATIEVLEHDLDTTGAGVASTSEEMVQESKEILEELPNRAKTISDIIKEHGGTDATASGEKEASDVSESEAPVESH